MVLELIIIGTAIWGFAAAGDAVQRWRTKCSHGVRGNKPCLLCEQKRQDAISRRQKKDRDRALAQEEESARLKEIEFRNLQDIESLSKIDPYSFELLCASLYEQMGWCAETTPKTADGGIDVVITRSSETRLIQCKRLRRGKVGVAVVRDLFGVVTAAQASGGIVITTSTFTDGAIGWAGDKNIELVDGTRLSRLIRQYISTGEVLPDIYVQERASAQRIEKAMTQLRCTLEEPCPQCGERVAIRKGRHGKFIGCSGYPNCRHTVAIPESIPTARLNRTGRSIAKRRRK